MTGSTQTPEPGYGVVVLVRVKVQRYTMVTFETASASAAGSLTTPSGQVKHAPPHSGPSNGIDPDVIPAHTTPI